VAQTVEKFGGIDIVVNNASAIDVSDPETLAMKKYDLMQSINARGRSCSAAPPCRTCGKGRIRTC